MTYSSTASVADVSKGRARVTNSPLSGRKYGRSPEARRIRDLFSALMERLGQPVDPVIVADALALAELKTAAETARSKLLNGTDADPDQLVRLENLVRRAERRLDLRPGAVKAAVPSPREYFASFAASAAPTAAQSTGLVQQHPPATDAPVGLLAASASMFQA